MKGDARTCRNFIGNNQRDQRVTPREVRDLLTKGAEGRDNSASNMSLGRVIPVMCIQIIDLCCHGKGRTRDRDLASVKQHMGTVAFLG